MSAHHHLSLIEPQRATPLYVLRLVLSHFRNYEQSEVLVSAAPVILTGNNGAGKTNLLEAISLLTPGRGFRKAALSEISQQGSDAPWAVAATIGSGEGEYVIGTGLDPENIGEEANDKRIVKIDGKKLRGQTELAKRFAAVWLTPQMDQLFQEGGTARRKYIDRMVYGFEPDHASRLHAYEQAMRERNRLLQMGGGFAGDRQDAWLGGLEQTMSEKAVTIAIARRDTVERINHSIQAVESSFPKGQISLSGWLEHELESGVSALQAEAHMREKFASLRSLDAAMGRTSEGIHRTQVQVMHVEKQTEAAACSTGEQKALLLCMALAQVHARSHWHGAAPVLLLDEVIAHLDATRRAALFETITQLGVQAWMTGTDEALFASFSKTAQFLNVANGAIA